MFLEARASLKASLSFTQSLTHTSADEADQADLAYLADQADQADQANQAKTVPKAIFRREAPSPPSPHPYLLF
jgi:hypothetical protein